MSQQQSTTQSRQLTSYPSPHSYPSPSMSAYAYPPPTSGQSVEPYRASPTGSHVSLPSLNLPPIRNIDGRSASQQQQQQVPPQQQQQQPQQQQQQPQQQQQQQQQPQQQQTSGQNAMGSPLPPPIAQMPQYYHNQAQSLPPPPQHMNVTSDPNQALRYPLPAAPDGRMMSGGRHKKEIKRRTKTGCLTCRKRRIKCDEAHPTCKNCLKSKRECLGYDPIFKAQPGPAAIQPAPSSAPSMQNASVTSSPYPPPPQGYMPAAAQPYAPSLTAGAHSPDSSTEPYDYSVAIDPALEGAGTSQMQVPLSSYDGTDLRQGVKPTKIEDLLNVSGFPPPSISTPTSIPPSTYDEIKHIYTTVYAPGIDKFLETRWFATRGLSYLLQDSRLCEQYSTLINRFSMHPAGDYHANAVTQSLEANVIWSTMCLCHPVSAAASGKSDQKEYIEVNEGVHDASKRVGVFETLVTNQYLDAEPLPTPTPSTRNGSVLDEQLKQREREFWHLVGKFLTLHDDEASSAKEIDDTLTACRHLLDTREQRDVIYSIAIARHVGQRMAESLGAGNESLKKDVEDENDARTKLMVAKRFIEHQAGGKGTTQVVQRVCGMAIRSWGGVR